MSTRANIILKDERDELIFYRHSDGYPEGVMPTLEKFLRYLQENRIRDNVGQAAGWLIVIGREEYNEAYSEEYYKGKDNYPRFNGDEPRSGGKVTAGDYYGGLDWKVGAYEPTTDIHGDIQHLYVVDLTDKTIRHCALEFDAQYNPIVPAKFYSGRFKVS